MRLVHLTSSIFYGGPERQMLGMADALPAGHEVTFISFAEDGRCEPFHAARQTCALDRSERHDGMG